MSTELTDDRSGAFSEAPLKQMHSVLRGHVDSGGLPGVVTLISRRGEVDAKAIGSLAFGGTEPMQRDTIFRIASISKVITAVSAMILVEAGKLGLDDPINVFLPELANPKVLRRLDSGLDDTVPASRSITVRDLLSYRLGAGFTMEMFNGALPIVKAINERLGPIGPMLPVVTPDEFMRRLGSLPLVFQPGERFLYNTAGEVLSVLIARASGQPLGEFMAEHIFKPLGMQDTGFFVPADKMDRLAEFYFNDPATGTVELFDDPEDSRWALPPVFPSGAGGLVSTADDLLAFGRMLLNGGTLGDACILLPATITEMTTNQLTTEQKAGGFLPKDQGWGLGLCVDTGRDGQFRVPGRFGWDGGYGTSFAVDPENELIGILLTQKMWDSPVPPPVYVDFWTNVYAAIGK
ncbi:MAG: serine hydrolase domain-containing protein [Pyrinomonadaceae bacterium]